MKKILLVEDNEAIQKGLKYSLEQEKFVVELASDVKTAKDKLAKSEFNLIILDVMLPDGSGFELCRDIKKNMTTPILFLTAKDEEQDVVNGFDLGADDYVVKPFSAREVVARIKAVLRRFNTDGGVQSQVIRRPGLEINIANYDVRINGESIPFTPKEVEILYLLASNPGRVFDREHILSKVWGYDFFGDTRAVDTQIKRIRQKLPDEELPWSIKTVYGVGYKFEVC